MADYATFVNLKIMGKKLIFFKKLHSYFYAIYYDEKFYKKSKWPGHLGRLSYKFVGKGNYGTVPEYLKFDTAAQVGEKYMAVDYGPSQEEAAKFVNDVGGKFEILDSAKYTDKKGNVYFTVYNVFDNDSKKYVVFVVGGVRKSSKVWHKSMVNFVNRDLRKAFFTRATIKEQNSTGD